MKRGFTLIENIIAVAIFCLLAGVIYQTSTLLSRNIGIYRENVAISNLAKEYIEVIHSLPYSEIETLGLSLTTKNVNGKDYQISYIINLTNDYKQVKLTIQDTLTNKTHSFVTDIAPIINN